MLRNLVALAGMLAGVSAIADAGLPSSGQDLPPLYVHCEDRATKSFVTIDTISGHISWQGPVTSPDGQAHAVEYVTVDSRYPAADSRFHVEYLAFTDVLDQEKPTPSQGDEPKPVQYVRIGALNELDLHADGAKASCFWRGFSLDGPFGLICRVQDAAWKVEGLERPKLQVLNLYFPIQSAPSDSRIPSSAMLINKGTSIVNFDPRPNWALNLAMDKETFKMNPVDNTCVTFSQPKN